MSDSEKFEEEFFKDIKTDPDFIEWAKKSGVNAGERSREIYRYEPRDLMNVTWQAARKDERERVFHVVDEWANELGLWNGYSVELVELLCKIDVDGKIDRIKKMGES